MPTNLDQLISHSGKCLMVYPRILCDYEGISQKRYSLENFTNSLHDHDLITKLETNLVHNFNILSYKYAINLDFCCLRADVTL